VLSETRRSAAGFVSELRYKLVVENARALPGFLVLVVILSWAGGNGGFTLTDWYEGALFLLALLVVTLVADREALSVPTWSTAVALAALVGLACWSLASILWAGAKDDAWDGGNRVVTYVIVFVLIALIPATPKRAAVLLGSFAAGVAVLTAWPFFSGSPETVFINGRLAEPIGYPSATAALCLMAIWPAAALASAREVPPYVRAPLLGVAAVLLQFAVLAESRGSVLALVVATVAYIAFVPSRPRALLVSVVLAAVAVASWGSLTAVFAGLHAGRVSELGEARAVIAVTFLATTVVGVLIAELDRRFGASSAARWTGRLLQLFAVTFVLLAGGLWIVNAGNPVDRVESAWTDFKSGYPQSFGASRLTGELGTTRYDFWVVALHLFRSEPVTGVGADNFSLEYLKERNTGEEPTYPHSIEIEILSQTGIVGAALFVAALIAAAIAYIRRRRELDGFGQLVAASAMAGFVYWLLHASVDWFWELPGLGGAAFMFLGLAIGISGRDEISRDRESRVLPWARPLGLLACIAVALSFVFPWLSARAIDDALAGWRTDPKAAQVRLAQARELNPLSDRADEIAGAIASRTGDVATMRRSFERAVERNPQNWYSRFELGIAYALSGDDDAALTELTIAEELNPRERLIHDVRAQVLLGLPVSPASIDARFRERAEALVR